MTTFQNQKTPNIQILAISGSLRASSSNARLLQAAALLAPKEVKINLYQNLGELPHFNPGLDDFNISAVLDFRNQLKNSHAVIISSPEYAHGVPGTLKNALDWIVGSGELVEKPIALFNTSARSTFAQASLKETISVMLGRIVEEASITLPFIDKNLDANEIAANPEIARLLKGAIDALLRSIDSAS